MQSKIRFEIFKRDKFICQYCGAKSPDVILQIDHKIALAKGGSDSPENLITACLNCNKGKASNDLNENQLSKYNKESQIKYAQFKVPAELHNRIKTVAAKKGLTIIKLLEELVRGSFKT